MKCYWMYKKVLKILHLRLWDNKPQRTNNHFNTRFLLEVAMLAVMHSPENLPSNSSLWTVCAFCYIKIWVFFVESGQHSRRSMSVLASRTWPLVGNLSTKTWWYQPLKPWKAKVKLKRSNDLSCTAIRVGPMFGQKQELCLNNNNIIIYGLI